MDRLLRDRTFRQHVIIYAAVNFGLVAINLLSKPPQHWFWWPLIGWGLGLLAHAVKVLRRPDVPPRPVPRP